MVISTRWRILITAVLYGAYLPLSGYASEHFRFDAAEYWELSLKFTQQGHFSLLAYDEPLRGYLGPLLIMPARLLCHFTGWTMLSGARVLGTCWAALLFGAAIPALWKQLARRPLSGKRWLVLLMLAFIFWRDYFNFTLSDMPALTVLLLGLSALARKGWGWAGAGGLLLAAAINMRPIYLASLPGAIWLLGLTYANLRVLSTSIVALVLGGALVLAPQWLINTRYFHQNTPLVLAALPGSHPLYLKQLAWGTAFQRYESSLIPQIPRSLVYADPGAKSLVEDGITNFTSYGQYLQFVAQRPVETAARYSKHLFNGLDIKYPTPYPTQWHPRGQMLLRLFNYVLLGVGTWMAGRAILQLRHATYRRSLTTKAGGAVGLALVLPCLLAVPTLMECRFLLPLHLMLLTSIAGCGQPITWWRALPGFRQRVAVLVLAGAWLWGCWQLSESTARQLRPLSEAPQ